MIHLSFTPLFLGFGCLFLVLFLWTIGIKKSKQKWVLLAFIPIFMLLSIQKTQQDKEVQTRQIAYVEQSFQHLYRPNYLHITKVHQKDKKDHFRVETEHGEYAVSFDRGVLNQFRVDQVEGESLRERKNVADVLQMVGIWRQGGNLYFEELGSYRYFVEDSEYHIFLTEETVVKIEDAEGTVVHEQKDGSQQEGSLGNPESALFDSNEKKEENEWEN